MIVSDRLTEVTGGNCVSQSAGPWLLTVPWAASLKAGGWTQRFLLRFWFSGNIFILHFIFYFIYLGGGFILWAEGDFFIFTFAFLAFTSARQVLM